MTKVFIKEGALIAKLATKLIKSKNAAIVINKTIYVYNVTAVQFLSDKSWVLHELKHVEQYERYGIIRFIILYLIESVKKGYRKNRFEVEARGAETETSLFKKFSIQIMT